MSQALLPAINQGFVSGPPSHVPSTLQTSRAFAPTRKKICQDVKGSTHSTLSPCDLHTNAYLSQIIRFFRASLPNTRTPGFVHSYGSRFPVARRGYFRGGLRVTSIRSVRNGGPRVTGAAQRRRRERHHRPGRWLGEALFPARRILYDIMGRMSAGELWLNM